jgi:hypothetical protein
LHLNDDEFADIHEGAKWQDYLPITTDTPDQAADLYSDTTCPSSKREMMSALFEGRHPDLLMAQLRYNYKLLPRLPLHKWNDDAVYLNDMAELVQEQQGRPNYVPLTKWLRTDVEKHENCFKPSVPANIPELVAALRNGRHPQILKMAIKRRTRHERAKYKDYPDIETNKGIRRVQADIKWEMEMLHVCERYCQDKEQLTGIQRHNLQDLGRNYTTGWQRFMEESSVDHPPNVH